MAQDIFHQIVKTALLKEGWEITHDPYLLETLATTLNIDLGAEKIIAAQREKDFIAVEIKSFLGKIHTFMIFI
jgi:hypothetical protein